MLMLFWKMATYKQILVNQDRFVVFLFCKLYINVAVEPYKAGGSLDQKLACS